MGLLVSTSCISQMNENFPSCTISYRGVQLTRTCVSSFRVQAVWSLAISASTLSLPQGLLALGSELWAWNYGGASERLSTMQETQVRSLGREDPWKRKWSPLQYYCLENPMDGVAWQARGHGVTKSPIRLSDSISTFTFCSPLQNSLHKNISQTSIQLINCQSLSPTFISAYGQFQNLGEAQNLFSPKNI